MISIILVLASGPVLALSALTFFLLIPLGKRP
jgi:hypothetical protein